MAPAAAVSKEATLGKSVSANNMTLGSTQLGKREGKKYGTFSGVYEVKASSSVHVPPAVGRTSRVQGAAAPEETKKGGNSTARVSRDCSYLGRLWFECVSCVGDDWVAQWPGRSHSRSGCRCAAVRHRQRGLAAGDSRSGYRDPKR